jgi:hypothetical protein
VYVPKEDLIRCMRKPWKSFLNKILWWVKVENVQIEDEVDLDIPNVPTNNKFGTLQNVFRKMTRTRLIYYYVTAN